MEAPRQGRLDGPPCRLEVFEPWVAALDGLERYERIEVLYWLPLVGSVTQTSCRHAKLTTGCGT
jgi:tRNA (Thr-GGU) A37 N-methylase